MEFTLDRLRLDQMAVVTQIDTPLYLLRKLEAYGLIPGTRVFCRYRSPDGSVIALEFRGCVVALRRTDLKRIWGCG